MLANKNLKILQNSIIKDMLISSKIIATILINNNVDLTRINIIILVIYHETIKDLIWEKFWKKVIDIEFIAFVINRIWKEISYYETLTL